MKDICRRPSPFMPLVTCFLIAAPWCEAVPKLAGYWSVTENATLKVTIDGKTDKHKAKGTRSIHLYQSGSTVYYYATVMDPNTGNPRKTKRTGVISGNRITFKGIGMLAMEGASYTANSLTLETKLSKDKQRIEGISKINVRFAYKKHTGSVTGGGTVVMTRE